MKTIILAAILLSSTPAFALYDEYNGMDQETARMYQEMDNDRLQQQQQEMNDKLDEINRQIRNLGQNCSITPGRFVPCM